jgi:hypothetical protein
MTRVDTHTYPELRQLFGAYLNAEFEPRHGSVAGALAAYRAETGAGHRAAARAELDRLTAAPGAVMRLHGDFAELGCEVALSDSGAAWGLAASIRRALSDGDDGIAP